jgi:hypothetical protein
MDWVVKNQIDKIERNFLRIDKELRFKCYNSYINIAFYLT